MDGVHAVALAGGATGVTAAGLALPLFALTAAAGLALAWQFFSRGIGAVEAAALAVSGVMLAVSMF